MKVLEEDEKPTPTPPSPTPSSKSSRSYHPTQEELEQLSTEAGLRQLIRDRLPTAESPPNYVRLWLGGYFTYRGLDPVCAHRFFWSGAEFMELALPELVEAFRAKLMMATDLTAGFGSKSMGTGVTEAEVEMFAGDVFGFIQSGKPPFWARVLARIRRLMSPQATMGERLDAFLVLVTHLGILLLVALAGISGLWAYVGFDKAVAELLQQARSRLGIS